MRIKVIRDTCCGSFVDDNIVEIPDTDDPAGYFIDHYYDLCDKLYGGYFRQCESCYDSEYHLTYGGVVDGN